MTDRQLLNAYDFGGSGEAFARLVSRHTGLVYSACLRRLGDRHLAEDATQAVFMVLARKAGRLRRDAVLSDWLFRTARNVAANFARARRRLRAREETVRESSARAESAKQQARWPDVRPHLDAAVAALPSKLRSALLLHYMEGKPQTEVAAELGCTRTTVRARINRGLEQLRSRLAGSGVTVSCAALASMFASGAAIESLPAGLISAITGACLGHTAASATAVSIAEGTMKAMTWTKLKLIALVVSTATVVGGGGMAASTLLAAEPALESTAAAAPAGAKDVLTENSYWRWHVTLRPPTYADGGEEKILKRTIKARLHGGTDQLKSPPPPANWAGADFDDSAWPRSRMNWCRWLAFSRFSTTRAQFRGKFKVTNPGGADLYLTMKYIGGAVVYLNGREVHRSDVPAGKLEANTFATAYEKKHYMNESGTFHSMRSTAARPKLARMRTREMKSIRLPKAALKSGVNVLGVEVIRSSYQPFCKDWFGNKKNLGQKPWWPHADLFEVRLKSSGAGAVPNVAKPAGVQVWVHDRNDRVAPGDYGDPNEKLRPLRIVGAKNGSFCGQLVVGSKAALAGVQVTPSEIKGPGGDIPAKNVTVLYGQLDWKSRKYGAWSHGLLEKAPEGASVLPVLLRVKIPADAKPGDYRGSIAVSAGGKTFNVPLELYVADWKVPDAKNYRTYMGVYQSPTSLAMKWEVKLWSEEHWKLIEKSFELLGRIGNKMVNIPVVEETQFGNDESMVRWIKKGSGWEQDLSVMERYLDLAVKHCGKQDYVCLQIWHAGGWTARKADNKCTVTVLDKAGPGGKKVSSQQVPVFGKPESVTFWKPALAKIKALLEKRGMGKAMTVGILSDSTAPNEVFEMFKKTWPGGDAMWHRGCHGVCRATTPYKVGKAGGNRVQLHEHCYGMSMVKPEVSPLPAFHTFRGRPGTAYFRVSGHEHATTLVSYRTMAERGLFCGKQGIGRICLDFFQVMKGARGRKQDIYNRFPHSSCAQRRPTLNRLVWASPQGPATTMRYEALCEGVQESDALLVVSEGAAKAGGQLAKDCEKCIRDHISYAFIANQHQWATSWVHMNHSGWQELSKRTFDLAGKVSKKLGK